MSFLLGVIATATPVVHAVATATPTPSPAVVQAAVAHSNSITDTLNQLSSYVSQADLLVVAGFVAWGVQELINKFANVRKALNWLISFALPFAGVALASFASGQNDLHLAPVVYLLGQAAYFIIERIKATVKVTEPVEVPVTQL